MIPKVLRDAVVAEAISEKEVPESFYFTNNFPVTKSPESMISWDIYHKDRGLAPITSRETQAPLWTGGGFSTMLATPAFIQEKISHSEKQLNDANVPDPVRRALYELHLMENVEDLVARNDRTVEYLAARMMLNHGVVVYRGSNNLEFTIDFKFPASYQKTLATDDKWGTGSTRSPGKDIATGKKAVYDAVGSPVTAILLNDTTLQLLAEDEALQTLLYASAFGDKTLNMVVDPLGTLTATLKAPFVVYDESMPLSLEIVSGSGSSWVFRAPTPVEVGTELTFQAVGLDEVEHEEVGIVATVTPATGAVTLESALSRQFVPGKDLVQARIPFLKDRRLVFMADKFRTKPMIEWRDCPFGLPVGQYGKQVKSWEGVDPESTFTRVQRSGLWLPRTNKGVYTLDV